MQNRVKAYRIALSLSQQDLAKRVGITRQTLSLIEKTDYNPSLKLCLAICTNLNQSLDAVFWPKTEEGSPDDA